MFKIKKTKVIDGIYSILEGFLSENEVLKEEESLLTISDMDEIKSNINKKIEEVDDSYKEYAGMPKERSIAIDLIDILEDKLSEKDIYISDEDRENQEDEACIFGTKYYSLEDEITGFIERNL